MADHTPNLSVRRGVERVARDCQDVDVAPVRAQPLLCDFRPVRHDAHARQVQRGLRELAQLAEVLGIQEELAAGKVELLHALCVEQREAALGGRERGVVTVELGVEVEAVGGVAFVREVVVDAEEDHVSLDMPLVEEAVAVA